MSKKDLFRKEALERLSSPERLDTLMQVVGPKDWLPLSALGTILIAALVWSIFGRLPISVSGRGVLTRPREVTNIQSSVSGQLESLMVGDGECVAKDQVLAIVTQSDLQTQLRQRREFLAQQQRQYQQWNLVSTQGIALEEQALVAKRGSLVEQLQDLQNLTPTLRSKSLSAIAQQRLSLQQDLSHSQNLAPILEKRLKSRQELLEAGGISQDTLLQAEQEYQGGLQRISDLETQLRQLELQETESQQKYQQNLSNIAQLESQLEEIDSQGKRLEQQSLESEQNRQNQIEEIERDIGRLEQQVAENSQIFSPNQGCILELTAKTGEVVQPGTTLATLRIGEQADNADNIVVMSYFPIKNGKQIKPGMTMQITPDQVKRERFGGIIGKVTSVSSLPVTREGVSSLIGNPELVRNIMPGEEAQIEVLVELISEPSNVSGYRWSSSAGPDIELSPGTTTTSNVIVEERAPITFVLPILREWSGLQ